MIIEFGNHAALRGVDDAPKVTAIHVPEADETGQGGYTHAPGALTVEEFRAHRSAALDYRGGVTQLPDHEILLAVVSAWPSQSTNAPAWVNVIPHDLSPDGHSEDIANFLAEFYGGIPVGRPADLEEKYWTKYGAPGDALPQLPNLTALFTNDGRAQQAINYGGGQVGAGGTGTAATATTFTSGSTWTTNQWTGYRLVVSNSAGAMVWGNIISNTNAASASVATVDRWYNFATPGGAAGTTPANGWFWAILDGGMTSAWFVGLTTTNITPAATDHTLSGEYTTASGGYLRKIAPYALTSGTSPMTYTLTPVFTGNGSDTYPSTFFAIGVFTSMVTGFGGAGGPMKFETSLNASATVNASGDQITVTETVTGS